MPMHCRRLTSDSFICFSVVLPGLENTQKLVTAQIQSEEKGYKLDGFVCILT